MFPRPNLSFPFCFQAVQGRADRHLREADGLGAAGSPAGAVRGRARVPGERQGARQGHRQVQRRAGPGRRRQVRQQWREI